MTDTLVSAEQLAELVESIWRSLLGLSVTTVGDDAIMSAGASLTARVQITGAFRGSVVLSFSECCARRAASRMLAVPESSVEDLDLHDAVAELCNILGGNIKSLLPGPSSLSLPAVAERIVQQHAPEELIAVLRFICDGELLEVQVTELHTREPESSKQGSASASSADTPAGHRIQQPNSPPFSTEP